MSRKFFILAAGLVSAAALVPLPTQGRATESEVVLNLDPSLDNPRNSEGAFVALKSGSSLFPVEPPHSFPDTTEDENRLSRGNSVTLPNRWLTAG